MKRIGKEHIKKLIISDFVKNTLTLTTGTAIAQIIPFIIAPILSRIYTPEDFGRLAMYLSIVQIFSSIAGGRYELAVLLPKEKEKGIRIVILSIVIVFLVSFFSLLIIIFFSKQIAFLLGDPKLELWLYLVPISIVMIGIFNSLNYFNTREKLFKNIAKANVFKASGGGIIQLILGFFNIVTNGLILGQVLSHLFGNLKMAKSFYKHKEIIKTTKKKDLLSLAIRYSDFPKYSVLGILLNTLSLNVINFFISILFSVSSLGFYSYAYKYLGFPITLIANSIGQVYFQKMSELKSNPEGKLIEFRKSVLRLFLISIILFFPLFFIVEDLFAFVFGAEWRVAGRYAKILIPLFSVRFIVSPLTSILVIMERQGVELMAHLLILLTSVLVWGYAYYLNSNIDEVISLYTVVLSIVYILILLYIYILLKNTNDSEIMNSKIV